MINSKRRIILIVVIVLTLLSANVLAKGGSRGQSDFNFKDVELKDAFRALADMNQMNLITDSSVEGRVTIRLEDISFLDAVELLAKTNDLDYLIIDNTILVATPERLDRNFRAEDREKVTRLFKIENAEPEEVKESLEVLFDGLTISIDNRTNSLLVKADEEDIAGIEAIISDLDLELKQVYLEAEIISLNITKAEELGVEWEISDNDFSLNLFGFTSGGDREIGLSRNSDFITANFLRNRGISNTLAKPKLSVIDGENAFINIGREVPVLIGVEDGNEIIERVDVGNILDITPRIIGENKILVEIEQELSSIDKEDFSGRGASFETTRTTTTVRVGNGETFVISGLIQEDRDEGSGRVPFLGDIPLLGYLFRSSSQSLQKREIIVFITPKILGSEERQEIKSPLIRDFILEEREKNKNEITASSEIEKILTD